jgi:hypothetical protein
MLYCDHGNQDKTILKSLKRRWNMKRLAICMMMFCSVMAVSAVAWCGDNGNGTVTVNGQVWLKDAGCLGKMNWNDAITRPKSLADGQCGLTDKSKAGDWRLPTVDELKAMYAVKSQFMNVQAFNYWSASLYPGSTVHAQFVGMGNGGIASSYYTASYYYVWPVRGGQ